MLGTQRLSYPDIILVLKLKDCAKINDDYDDRVPWGETLVGEIKPVT